MDLSTDSEEVEAEFKNSKYILGAGLLLAVLIFIMDIQTPLGVADGVAYVAVVLLTMWVSEPKYVYYAALVAIVLTIAGFYLSPPGSSMSIVIPNRVLAVVVIIVTAIIILSFKKAQEISRSVRREMDELIHKNMQELVAVNSELELRVKERTVVLTEALSNLKIANAETEQALKKEKDLNEMKSRFVTMASHEFRTPLSTILSSIDLISKYPDDGQNEKRLKHIERIKSAVHNLTDILEDFLSFGKLEEGKVAAVRILFNLEKCCEQVVLEMQAIAKKGQLLKYDYVGNNEEVLLDPKIMRNILINILSNAVKFSEEGKEIVICVKKREKEVEIVVKDNGIGIPESDQKHMFERFFRAGNVINIQGTGLGLNIVSKYVEMMKGEILLHSVLGVGTTVIIKFPLI